MNLQYQIGAIVYIDLLMLLISFVGGEYNFALICLHSNLHIFSAPNLFVWIPFY